MSAHQMDDSCLLQGQCIPHEQIYVIGCAMNTPQAILFYPHAAQLLAAHSPRPQRTVHRGKVRRKMGGQAFADRSLSQPGQLNTSASHTRQHCPCLKCILGTDNTYSPGHHPSAPLHNAPHSSTESTCSEAAVHTCRRVSQPHLLHCAGKSLQGLFFGS